MNNTDTISISTLRNFDPADFHRRWTQARLSALRPRIASAAPDEKEALRVIAPGARDAVLREVFEASRKFALSASRHFGIRCELADFMELLSASPITCMNGKWRPQNESYVSSRSACLPQDELTPFHCDYWREAIDGLVMGLGESERFARHGSAGHGDLLCVDILYSEATRETNRFGKIPSEWLETLEDIRAELQKRNIAVNFEGVSEGTLFFRMMVEGRAACGAGGRLLQQTLERQVHKRFPGLALRDISPLAVYGEKA